MIRRLTLLVLATALIVSACGRQVTPTPAGSNGTGISPGFMELKFRTSQAMNFTTTRYWIVFNTSGTGTTPYANASLSNYLNYSFAFVVGGNGVTVTPLLYEYVAPSNGAQAVAVQLFYTPQQVIFTQNSNGQNTEYTLLFARSLFSGVATPAPVVSNTWFYNFFTTDTSNNPLDALGTGGASDTSYQGGPLSIASVFDTTINVPTGAVQAPYAAAQITGGEIINSP